jgi:hypothetical protein
MSNSGMIRTIKEQRPVMKEGILFPRVSQGGAAPIQSGADRTASSCRTLRQADSQTDETPGPLSQLGGLAVVALHQDFRNAASSKTMPLGIIDGDVTLLELLGFSLAVLSIWFWVSW